MPSGRQGLNPITHKEGGVVAFAKSSKFYLKNGTQDYLAFNDCQLCPFNKIQWKKSGVTFPSTNFGSLICWLVTKLLVKLWAIAEFVETRPFTYYQIYMGGNSALHIIAGIYVDLRLLLEVPFWSFKLSFSCQKMNSYHKMQMVQMFHKQNFPNICHHILLIYLCISCTVCKPGNRWNPWGKGPKHYNLNAKVQTQQKWQHLFCKMCSISFLSAK